MIRIKLSGHSRIQLRPVNKRQNNRQRERASDVSRIRSADGCYRWYDYSAASLLSTKSIHSAPIMPVDARLWLWDLYLETSIFRAIIRYYV